MKNKSKEVVLIIGMLLFVIGAILGSYFMLTSQMSGNGSNEATAMLLFGIALGGIAIATREPTQRSNHAFRRYFKSFVALSATCFLAAINKAFVSAELQETFSWVIVIVGAAVAIISFVNSKKIDR